MKIKRDADTRVGLSNSALQERLIYALQEAESIIGSGITECLLDLADPSHRHAMLKRWRILLIDCGASVENLVASPWHTPDSELRKRKK